MSYNVNSLTVAETFIALSVANSYQIHAGNRTKDTLGCILVGLGNNDTQLFESRAGLALLMNELNGQSFKLEIIENYG